MADLSPRDFNKYINNTTIRLQSLPSFFRLVFLFNFLVKTDLTVAYGLFHYLTGCIFVSAK